MRLRIILFIVGFVAYLLIAAMDDRAVPLPTPTPTPMGSVATAERGEV